ncbi:hypothetical protein NUU61_009259 [Penicillium alfredii]|uniref:Cleavage/polyadenylation specificity factor A subunit N-terminal domain-containing protein n=1 Tax=Penicillium alfredii TaxID=1506179 RepID=A0A9W9EMW5_9EURO|nr:uncharacterized protein NUU61_009259 [Penicillium alfredii]KAJ5084680.1 hypothetical protein NUU61_009259 [Penicillium alfredii]
MDEELEEITTRRTRPTRHIKGLMKQSILPSPTFRFIIPARIRSKSHSDVVFISERCIQIKEAVAFVELDAVAEINLAGMTGSILGAQVIGVHPQLPRDSSFNPGSSVGNEIDLDLDNSPAHILVLALDERFLLFIYYSTSCASFLTYYRPMPSEVNLSEKYGAHLAVDPKSRAVAIGAATQYFGMLWLKSPDDLQQQIAGDKLDPISDERFYMAGGDILFMEFLYPQSADDKRIILLLITCQDGVGKAVIYEWKEGQGTRRPEIKEIKLRDQDRLPTMVVPLTKESAFLLITPTSMIVYQTHDLTTPKRYPSILPDTQPDRAGLWTRWARPSRNLMYSKHYDGIYLCREDGWIYYLEFGNEAELESQTSLGQLECGVDNAFDVLDVGHEGADFILAAGETGDGGLFIQEARDQPKCVQRFLNWAPMLDAVVVPSEIYDPSEKDIAHDRLFVCSASTSGCGSITELRHGIEAQVGVTAPLGDLLSIRDMWAMTNDVNGGIYVLLSHPMSSVLLFMNPDLEDGISALDEEETGLDTAQTLAAGCTPSGVIVQVTEKAIHLFVPHQLSSNTRVQYEPRDAIITAAVDGPGSLVVSAFRRCNEMSLHFARIDPIGETVGISKFGEPLNIDKEPICLLIQAFGDGVFVFMGTGKGTLLIFYIENDTATFLIDVKISIDVADDISLAIESLAVIRTASGGSLRAILFCGLRSGILVPFEIDFNASSIIGLKQKKPRRFGRTALRLQSKDNYALFTCGTEFWRVAYGPGDSPPDFFFWRVWITDQNNPAYFPVTLYGFELVKNPGIGSGLMSNCLFCFADGELLLCAFDEKAKPVPRRIGLPGNAKRLTYSKALRSLIVSYTIDSTEDPQSPFERTEQSYIEFVDPESQVPVAHRSRAAMNNDTEPWRPQSSMGEIITCIFDWTPQRDGQEYHLIAIGTSFVDLQDQTRRRGRVVLLKAARDPENPSRIDCFHKHMQVMPGPVHCMASYLDSLLVGTGRSVVPLTSSNSSTRWTRDAEIPLPSPAIALSVHHNLVIVTTSRHSTMIYIIADGTLVRRATGVAKHDGLSHCFDTDNPSLMYVSIRSGTVQMFQDIEDKLDDQTLPPFLGRAELPVSLNRLALGSRVPSFFPARAPVYGFGLNGSVYKLVALEEPETKLLRLLQNLYQRDTSIWPSSSSRRMYTPSLSAAVMASDQGFEVDGDILDSLAKRGPEYLQNLIISQDAATESSVVLVDWFREAAYAVLGESPNHYEVVIGWLRQMVHVEM